MLSNDINDGGFRIPVTRPRSTTTHSEPPTAATVLPTATTTKSPAIPKRSAMETTRTYIYDPKKNCLTSLLADLLTISETLELSSDHIPLIIQYRVSACKLPRKT